MKFRMFAGALFGLSVCYVAILNFPFLFQPKISQYLPDWLPGVATVPSVRISQGLLRGTTLDDGTFPSPVEAFLGVPYAVPPVGDLRFTRPSPAPPSDAVLDASSYGPR
jgi:acetylcholinesterase